MAAFRLTVGIPTYNRAKELSEAIDSVLEQATGRFQGQVEILVLDDTSTDKTREVVQGYAKRYPDTVVYRYNDINLGYDRNVDASVRYARGEFVLLLGDDDALDAHALETLWDILDQHDDLGVVILSETPYDPELRAPLVPAAERALRKGGALYRPGLEFVRQNRVFPPALISGYVVRREAWLQSTPSDFYDTICVHLLVALRIFVTHAAYVSQEPRIRYRTSGVGGDVWARDELYPFPFHLGLLIGCRGVKAVYPESLYRCLHKKAMSSIAYNIMNQKVHGRRIAVTRLRGRLKDLADARDPLYWVNLLLLRLPAWVIRLPFKAALRLRSGSSSQ